MYCKWYERFFAICCNGDCPERADFCPYEDEQEKCDFYESEGAE